MPRSKKTVGDPKSAKSAVTKRRTAKGRAAPVESVENEHRGAISRETYYKLRQAYLERQSIRHASKIAGVTFSTAKKYIDHGDPKRNMPAIKGIVRREIEKEKGEFELTLKAHRQQYVQEAKEALNGMLIEFRLHNQQTKLKAEEAQRRAKEALLTEKPAKIVKPSERLLDLVRSYEILIKLIERGLGGADETIDLKGADFVSRMTFEELQAYLADATIPARLR